jgi:hypothetical protein
MYVNRNMILVETIPGMGEESEFKYDTFYVS